MQREQKSDRMDECFRVGRELKILDDKRHSLLSEIPRLESDLNDINARLADIARDLAHIQFAQDTVRAAGSRGGVPGAIASEVTAQAIRLATQKGELERDQHRLEVQRSNLEYRLDERRRRFEDVGHAFASANARFGALDCPLGARAF